jgi:uncharacterized membrane protein YgdD (TMEM256/DUF423 family)
MTSDPPPRLFVAFGALCAAFGVGLSAYAAHGAQGVAAAQLSTAALFALLHGIALAALAPAASDRIRRIALALLALGTLLFSGSLAAHHAFGLPTRLAPAGGSLLIAGWLLYAVAAVRR